MQGYIGKPMMDPVYGASRVDKPLPGPELLELQSRISYDANNGIEALKLEASGNHSAAIEKWKHIFMRGFPQ